MIKDATNHVEADPVKANNRKRSVHEIYKVFKNTNSLSATESEMQDTVLEVDSTPCLPIARIEQTGMYTTKDPMEVNLASKKKRRKGSRKKKPDALQNSGQGQKLPEEDCLTSSNQVNPNASLMTKSEVQDTILEVDSTPCRPFARIEQSGMETTKDPMEVNLVSKKRRRKGSQKKKSDVLQNNGQAQKPPEEGCPTSSNQVNRNTSLMTKSEVQRIIFGVDRFPIASIETTKDPVEVNLVSKKRRRKGSRKKKPDVLQNNGQAKPEEGCQTSTNHLNINLFSESKTEVQDGILEVDSAPCPPLARTEHTGMETTKSPVEVKLVRKQKRKRIKKDWKKLYVALKNKGQAQKLPEKGGCPDTNHMNANSLLLTKSEVLDTLLEVDSSGQAQKLPDKGCLTDIDHMNTNSFSMVRSEVQDTILEADSTAYPPYDRIEQTDMEMTKQPVEVISVSEKKTRRASRKKKLKALQNSGQDQKLPEEGCPTSTNHMNANSFSMTKSGTILEEDSSGQAEKLLEKGCSTSTSHMNTNSFSKTNSEVLDTILVVDSNGQAQVADQVQSDQSKTAVNLSHPGTTRCGSGISAQKLPDKGCLSCTNHMNTNSFPMAKTEVQDTILEADSPLYPPFERIKQTDMETTENPVEVNLVSEKKTRRASRKKKPHALQNSGQAQNLLEEGCLTSTNHMNANSSSMTKSDTILEADSSRQAEKLPDEGCLTSTNRMNTNSFPMGMSEGQDTILEEDSTLYPPSERIKQADMETTEHPVEVNLVSEKKTRRASRKKKPHALQNSGQAQNLPEEGCPTSINHMNANSSSMTKSDTILEADSSGQAEKLPDEGCLTSTNRMNTNSFPMGTSEGQDTILEEDSTLYSPSERIKQADMETTEHPVEVNLVSEKKTRRASRKKKPHALQKSGQAQNQPEEGCPTSTNHMNANSSSMTKSETILEADSSGQAEKLPDEGCPTSTNRMNTNSFPMAMSEVQDTLLKADSTLYPPLERIKQVDMETTEHPVEVNLVSEKKTRSGGRKKRPHALQNSGQAQNLPEEGCPTSTNNPNIDSFSVSMSEVKDTILEVDLTPCPPFARIEQTDMETIKSPVQVNLVGKKKSRRSPKKLKALQDSGQAQQLPKEGCLTITNHMNIMSTLSVSDEKKSEEQVISSDADETKQVSLAVVNEKDRSSEVSHISLVRAPASHLRKKLLILDINGLLADIVSPPPKNYKSDINIAGRAIFKRPFCLDFLKFCFERFEVGVWSSRIKKNVQRVIDYLMGDLKQKLLLCWDLSHCTATSFKCPQNKHKPVVFKELRKIWEKNDPNLPWEEGDYNESNTLLLDDSPYKALLNPPHTAIFPYSYMFRDKSDNSLGPGGDLRVYLEGLAVAESTQKYVKQNPFGQKALTKRSKSWGFYHTVVESVKSIPTTIEHKKSLEEERESEREACAALLNLR